MLKVRKLYFDKVYGYSDEVSGFGDLWAVTSYLLRVSEESGKPTRFFTRVKKLKKTMKDIIPFLTSKGNIDFVDQPLQKILSYCEPYSVKFVPTNKTWSNNHNNIVAYQFDGIHLSEQKNLPLPRLRFLIKSLKDLGFIPVDVGHGRPIKHIIDILSECQFFVGCPSGLSVVSMSVGNPIMLITRNINPRYCPFMRRCQYKTRTVDMYRTVDEFIIEIRRRKQMGRLL